MAKNKTLLTYEKFALEETVDVSKFSNAMRDAVIKSGELEITIKHPFEKDKMITGKMKDLVAYLSYADAVKNPDIKKVEKLNDIYKDKESDVNVNVISSLFGDLLNPSDKDNDKEEK